jgi:hypothetical protein
MSAPLPALVAAVIGRGFPPAERAAVARCWRSADWRDVLAAAGFGDDLTAHIRWAASGGT